MQGRDISDRMKLPLTFACFGVLADAAGGRWTRSGIAARHAPAPKWMKDKRQTMRPMVFAKHDAWEQPAIADAQTYPCSLINLAVGLPHPTGG
jgi:hypothetical protein